MDKTIESLTFDLDRVTRALGEYEWMLRQCYDYLQGESPLSASKLAAGIAWTLAEAPEHRSDVKTRG